jgi:hypothetical protein
MVKKSFVKVRHAHNEQLAKRGSPCHHYRRVICRGYRSIICSRVASLAFDNNIVSTECNLLPYTISKSLKMDLQVALNNSHLHSFRDAVSLQALSHLSVISVMLTIFIAVFYTITCALSPKFDSQEPPVIPQKIPFIGHVLGLARFGITYYLEVRLVIVSFFLFS